MFTVYNFKELLYNHYVKLEDNANEIINFLESSLMPDKFAYWRTVVNEDCKRDDLFFNLVMEFDTTSNKKRLTDMHNSMCQSVRVLCNIGHYKFKYETESAWQKTKQFSLHAFVKEFFDG